MFFRVYQQHRPINHSLLAASNVDGWLFKLQCEKKEPVLAVSGMPDQLTASSVSDQTPT